MVDKKNVVKQALSFNGPLPYLPRGELFIERSFLDEIFPDVNDYFVKFKNTLSLLELDLVGFFYGQASLKEKDLMKLEDIFLVCNIQGPFSFLTAQFGFIEVLKALRKNRGDMFELIKGFLKDLKHKLSIYIDLGVGGIAVVDDIAGNNGVFFSKHDFNLFFKLVYSEIVDMIKSFGLFAFFHSDGNLEEYLRDFLNMGFDCLHTCDAQAYMDPYRLRENLKKRICFMGHIDLYGWTQEKIKMEVDKAKEMFLHGGLILGSSSGLSGGMLKEKIFTLYPKLKGIIQDEKI